MELISNIKEQLKPLGKRVAMPEYQDSRVVLAAAQIVKEGFATPVVIGPEAGIKEVATAAGVTTEGFEIIDPATTPLLDEMVAEFVRLREKKGMTPEAAKETMLTSDVFFGAMLVRLGHADAMIGGSSRPTADILRAAIQVVGMAPGLKTVSSSMLMFTKTPQYGNDGFLVFGDCGVIPNPTAEQLADIACSAVDKARKVAGLTDPRVALLSFSTKGSASSPEVEKVVEAVEILKSRNVDFDFDGELQLDASIVPSVAERKAKDSKVAGKANILIFPELEAANIGYKLVQRFGGAEALGPLIQGLAKPVHDLSRGCSVQDIVDVAAIACIESVEA